MIAATVAEQQLEQLIRTYVDTVNEQDCAAVAELFAFPAMMGGRTDEPITVPDAAAYRRIMEAALAQFRARGWVRSQVDRVRTVATAGGTGFVVLEFSRWSGSGSLVDSGRATYAAVLIDGRWRLIATMGS